MVDAAAAAPVCRSMLKACLPALHPAPHATCLGSSCQGPPAPPRQPSLGVWPSGPAAPHPRATPPSEAVDAPWSLPRWCRRPHCRLPPREHQQQQPVQRCRACQPAPALPALQRPSGRGRGLRSRAQLGRCGCRLRRRQGAGRGVRTGVHACQRGSEGLGHTDEGRYYYKNSQAAAVCRGNPGRTAGRRRSHCSGMSGIITCHEESGFDLIVRRDAHVQPCLWRA